LNYPAYAKLVAEASRRRRLVTAAAQVIEAQQGNAGADEFAFRLDNLQAALSAVATPPTAVASVREHFRPASDLEAPADMDTWQVIDFLRPKSLDILASPEGVGKSQARCELGIRYATGTGALFDHYDIPRRGRVMVLDEENGDAEEYRREDIILAALGLTRADLTDYFRLSFAGMNLTRPEQQRWLRGEIARIRPDLVILDTGGLMVGDEWGSSFKDAIRFLRSLIVEYGCSILVCVHLTKPPRENGHTRHGSALADVMGQWTRSADMVAVMTDLGAGRAQWTVRKRVPPSSLVLAQRGGIWQTVAVGEDHAETTADDRVLRAIAAGATSADGLVTALGLSRSGTYKVLARLRHDGMIAEGTPLSLTEAGLESVE
jgi:hypothetical protein